jgi:hypothetical protein
MAKIIYRRLPLDDLEIFYKEAGRPNAPAILLLQAFRLQATCFATRSDELR